MKREFYIDNMCNYILDSESEDFAENPSDNHVYYQALAALEGKNEADKYLKQAIKDLEAE